MKIALVEFSTPEWRATVDGWRNQGLITVRKKDYGEKMVAFRAWVAQRETFVASDVPGDGTQRQLNRNMIQKLLNAGEIEYAVKGSSNGEVSVFRVVRVKKGRI